MPIMRAYGSRLAAGSWPILGSGASGLSGSGGGTVHRRSIAVRNGSRGRPVASSASGSEVEQVALGVGCELRGDERVGAVLVDGILVGAHRLDLGLPAVAQPGPVEERHERHHPCRIGQRPLRLRRAPDRARTPRGSRWSACPRSTRPAPGWAVPHCQPADTWSQRAVLRYLYTPSGRYTTRIRAPSSSTQRFRPARRLRGPWDRAPRSHRMRPRS